MTSARIDRSQPYSPLLAAAYSGGQGEEDLSKFEGVKRGFMLAIVGLSKCRKGTIRVTVARRSAGSNLTRNYASKREAAAALEQIGVGVDAVEYYLFKLLPLVCRKEELSFPAMNIPHNQLLLLGFRVGAVSKRSLTRKHPSLAAL